MWRWMLRVFGLRRGQTAPPPPNLRTNLHRLQVSCIRTIMEHEKRGAGEPWQPQGCRIASA
jgi:hypothetical protein